MEGFAGSFAGTGAVAGSVVDCSIVGVAVEGGSMMTASATGGVLSAIGSWKLTNWMAGLVPFCCFLGSGRAEDCEELSAGLGASGEGSEPGFSRVGGSLLAGGVTGSGMFAG